MDKVIIVLLLAAGIIIIGKTMADLAMIFHDAVSRGNTTFVKLLLAIKPSLIDALSGKHRETPLHCASMHGYDHIALLLLTKGAAVNAKDCQDSTPLHLAAQRGDKETGELLIGRGADVNAVDDCGRRPLHLAAMAGPVDTAENMVELLLSHGAQLEAIDFDGRTPLICASRFGTDGIVSALVSRGADINAKDTMGMTPLAYAAMSLQLSRDMMELLIEKGAHINAKDEYGGTPLDHALHTLHRADREEDKKKLDTKQREIIDLLRRYGAKEPEEHPRGPGEGDVE